MANKVFITDTILRDAHQSQAATRMRIEDMLPACEALDKVGYWSLECWGGATFDSCMRFLGEDPWERLRKLKKAMPNTKLQMLLRGQNLLGYKHYADDVVEAFVKKSIENGIDVVRIFDALNDVRNIETAMKELFEVNLGGTLVGTGISADPKYAKNIIKYLAEYSGEPVVRAKDLVDNTRHITCFSNLSKAVMCFALNVHKNANDLRLMSCAYKTVILPEVIREIKNMGYEFKSLDSFE